MSNPVMNPTFSKSAATCLRRRGPFAGMRAALIACLALTAIAWGAPASGTSKQTTSNTSQSQEDVDKKAIKELYYQGDFEPLISLLESLRSQRRIRDREDSVFIFKYLGVLYGADTTTRRQAEAFLYQMLKLDPASGLEELMVSDEIVTLFREVKRRYLKRHPFPLESLPPPDGLERDSALAAGNGSAQADSGAIASAAPKPLEPKSKASSSPGPLGIATWKWVAGGAVVAAAAVGTVILVNQEPDPEVNRISAAVE